MTRPGIRLMGVSVAVAASLLLTSGIALAEPTTPPKPPPTGVDDKGSKVETVPAKGFDGSVWVKGAEAINAHTTKWATGCPDCRWLFVITCPVASPGNEFNYKCDSAEAACPGAGILYTAYLTTSGPLPWFSVESETSVSAGPASE